MRRLIVLPERPGLKSGYQIAVKADLERLCPGQNDTTICYVSDASVTERDNTLYKIVHRPASVSIKRLINLLSGRPGSELWGSDIRKFVKNQRYDSIFCGETTLYRGLKTLFPDSQLTVRFHNFFSASLLRNQFLQYNLPLQTRLNFYLIARLEKLILADHKVIPVFITKEEYAFFRFIYPAREAEVWTVTEAYYDGIVHPEKPAKPLIVWLGSLSTHKMYSLDYFINVIYDEVKKSIPDLEFHLFGRGTAGLNKPEKQIFGHGFYPGEGLPFGGKALFINPDLLGGGVKLKIKTLIQQGVPLITTPFGIEGYTIQRHDHLLIEDIQNWSKAIISYFLK
jgi:hypothetical protein